jgi:hypothetical protein
MRTVTPSYNNREQAMDQKASDGSEKEQ